MDLKAEKEELIRSMMHRDALHSKRVIDAFREVDRQDFVPERYKKDSYADHPLPIGMGQTISQPTTVAIMTEALDPKEDSKVLEVGAGSGYQAAILAHLADKVYTVERLEHLYNRAKEKLKKYDNVEVVLGDGSKGLEEHAPYNRIIVTASAPDVPKPLFEQLAEGGRMVLPVGSGFHQNLLIVEKVDGRMKKTNLGGFAFVPLVGEFGFKG